jgi:hypothetical protein
MKIFIIAAAIMLSMPPSYPVRSIGFLAAGCIVTASLIFEPAAPGGDPYCTAIKLIAGASMAAGSLLLARNIGAAFLRSGGRGVFKALYLASFASAGAGISEAASGLAAVNVPLAVSLATLAFTGAGIMLLLFYRGA